MKPMSLLFEFVNEQGRKQPLFFTEPINIIVADHQEEVLAKFSEVQMAVDSGYYAAGYVSYEAAPAFDEVFQVKDGVKMPLLWFGIFEKPSSFEGQGNDAFHLSDWTSKTSHPLYKAGFEKIKSEIKQGNTYQVNYTLRLQSQFSGDDYAFYQQLVKAQDSNYSAYLHTGRFQILSASPRVIFSLERRCDHYASNEGNGEAWSTLR